MQNCPFCNSKAVERDCGYSSFNPHWVECANKDCGWRTNGIAKDWDKITLALNGSGYAPPNKINRLLKAIGRLYSEEKLLKLISEYPSKY